MSKKKDVQLGTEKKWVCIRWVKKSVWELVGRKLNVSGLVFEE